MKAKSEPSGGQTERNKAGRQGQEIEEGTVRQSYDHCGLLKEKVW